ncbi:MAG: hypothetical protein IJW08_03070 [Lentisphaeria bacterium]|nr:hypothetical protein [Lentisphaeria bacterium]
MKRLLSTAVLSLAAVLSAASPEKILHVDFEDIKAKNDATGSVALRSFGNIQSVPGVVGNAALFDGKKTAVRNLKANLKLDKNTSFTVEFYIKPERNPSKGWSYPAMFNGIRFAGRPHINSPFLFITGSKKRLVTVGTGTASYNDNKWHHIALVRDAVKREIAYYCDGKKIAAIKETPAITEALAASSGFHIGAAGYTGYYKGAIDEFIIRKGVKTQFDLSNIKKMNKVEQPPVEISKAIAKSWQILKENKINLVPAPKTINVTGKAFDFKPSEWSVERKEKSDLPGYEHFVKRFASCGVKGEFSASGKKRIISGFYKDVAKELSFKSKCQPRQGYVLEVAPDKIIIAGTDADGIRYGWLTLSALLNESGKMNCVQITDYPDFVERGGHYGPYNGTAESLKKLIDEVFVLRLNRLYTTRILPIQDMPAHVKAINEYARARGIECGYVGVPSVGDIPDFRKKIPRGQDAHTYSYRSDEGMFGWYGHAISWSRDDLARAQAEKAANHMKKYGFTCFMMHPVDAGGIDNPSRWNSRSKKCREKWGNDFFSAQENLIKIYCDTFKQVYPECKMYYVAYPYMPSLLINGKFADHMRRLSKLLGDDVKMIVREGLVSDMKALQKIAPNIFTTIYPFQYDYLTMHCNGARYFATFYVNNLNSLGSYEIWSPAGSRCNASRSTYTEYLWNHNAPGAANKPEGLYTNYELITESSPEIENELLYRACAYMYGEKAAEVMAKVFAAKLSERHSEHPFKVLPISIDQEKYFASQVGLTDGLLRDMRKIKKDVLPEARDAWQQKYNFIRKVNLGSRARLHCIRANKFADAGKVQEAQAEAEKGTALLKTPFARSYRGKKLLMNELNIAEKLKSGAVKRAYAAQGNHRNITVGFYQYTGNGNGGSSTTMTLLSSFDKAGGIRTVSVIDPTKAALKNVDVIIFSATKYVGDTGEDWRSNIRNMVEKDGKGVIFLHNAVGREKLTNLGKQIFPEICSDCAGRVADHPVMTVVDDSIFKGFLKKGDKYTEIYQDHIAVTPGRDGKVILRDGKGNAVAVIGKVGRGYVVYSGEIFGVDRKDVLVEPAIDNWKMLYHLIRYASGE